MVIHLGRSGQAYSIVDRLTITRIGIGKAISIISVMTLRTPGEKKVRGITLRQVTRRHTEDDQLELCLTAYACIVLDGSTKTKDKGREYRDPAIRSSND
jgi:hypothetical protein